MRVPGAIRVVEANAIGYRLSAGMEGRGVLVVRHTGPVPGGHGRRTRIAWQTADQACRIRGTRLATVIGQPELATDECYATFADRRDNTTEFLALLSELFIARTNDDWIDGVAVSFVRLLCRVPIGGLNVADERFG